MTLYKYIYRNLKDHKFPTRKCYLLYTIDVYLKNILTLQRLEALRLGMGESLYSTTMLLVYFYTRPLGDVNQLEVGVYQ